MVDVPSFLLKVLENEIKDICIGVLKKVCDRHSLDFEEVCREVHLFGKNNEDSQLSLASERKQIINIVKKKPPKAVVEDSCRCMARVWNQGRGTQCTRRKIEGTELCTQHSKNLKHGLITDKTPTQMFVVSPKQRLHT